MGNRSDGPQHLCRQGRKCKSRVKDTAGKFHGVGVESPDSLCHVCEEHAFEAIRELGNDLSMLVTSVEDGRAAAAGPKVSFSAERPVPIDLGVDSLRGEIDNEVTRWAIRVTRGEELTNPHATLCANLGTLIDLPPQRVTVWIPHPDGGDDVGDEILDGVDAVLRLVKLHQRAQAMLGLTETTTFLPDPCPHCGRKALAVSKDQQRVTCKGCRIVWDSDHFALLSNVLDFERRRVAS